MWRRGDYYGARGEMTIAMQSRDPPNCLMNLSFPTSGSLFTCCAISCVVLVVTNTHKHSSTLIALY